MIISFVDITCNFTAVITCHFTAAAHQTEKTDEVTIQKLRVIHDKT